MYLVFSAEKKVKTVIYTVADWPSKIGDFILDQTAKETVDKYGWVEFENKTHRLIVSKEGEYAYLG